jgi:hypothetical protein
MISAAALRSWTPLAISALPRRAARLAVILVVHGPAVEPVAGEFVHHGIFAFAGHGEIEHPRRHRRAVHEEHDGPGRLARLRRADALAVHPQRNVALLGPVLAAPDIAGFRSIHGRRLRSHRATHAGGGHARADALDQRTPRQRIFGTRHGSSPCFPRIPRPVFLAPP